jgi:RNA polymerase sigma-70 factor (sigma-E family)
LARRDDDAFTAFAAGSGGRLRRTAYLLCGDWQQAADIVQEALIKVYVAWPRLDKGGGLATYARKAVISVATDMHRRRSSTERPSEISPNIASPTDIESSYADRDTVVKALAALPPRQRACVVLRYYEDLSVTETAEALGCSEGNVKSQTSRALTTLQQTIRLQSGEGVVVTHQGVSSW